MRYWWIGLALLPLASCGQAAEREPRNPMERAFPSAAEALLEGEVWQRQKGNFAPRDDCAEIPGATAFRRKLAEAVLARDAEAVAALAEPAVRLGFAGDDGRDRLRAKLPENKGELFGELEALLRLGCASDAMGGITMPWFFAQDYGDLDSYSAMLVMGTDVPLLAADKAGAAVKQTLSWDLVTLDKGWFPEKPFQEATTLSGAKGFVPTNKLRSMLDYRLLATRQNGVWKISAIVAGD